MLSVSTFVPQVHTASFYYRLMSPLRAMNDLGLPIRAMVDTDSSRVSPMQRVEAMCDSDICLWYQPIGQGPLNNARQLQSFIPSMRDGEWKYPPSIVLESDDNLFNVSPLNPAFVNLGCRDMDGNEIKDGHQVGLVQNGERVVKWIDGHVCDGTCGPGGKGNCGKGIDFAANREALNCYKQMVNRCDALTCSTQAVANAALKETHPARVRVFPNCIRFDDFEQVELAPHPKEVRILWQGGENHYEDWYPLRKQLGRITKAYPNVQWVIWGALYPWVVEEIPADRYTFKSWVPYQNYKDKLCMIGHDINLAPLASTPFNDCRSAIKWYESSALRRPAVTLAQNTAAYKAEIEDGETGLLFNTPEEFEEKLGYLIEQASERKRIAGNAKDWVSDHRDIMKRAPEIYSFWEELRAERRLEQPHASAAEWDRIEKEAEEEERKAQEQADKNGQPQMAGVA